MQGAWSECGGCEEYGGGVEEVALDIESWVKGGVIENYDENDENNGIGSGCWGVRVIRMRFGVDMAFVDTEAA